MVPRFPYSTLGVVLPSDPDTLAQCSSTTTTSAGPTPLPRSPPNANTFHHKVYHTGHQRAEA